MFFQIVLPFKGYRAKLTFQFYYILLRMIIRKQDRPVWKPKCFMQALDVWVQLLIGINFECTFSTFRNLQIKKVVAWKLVLTFFTLAKTWVSSSCSHLRCFTRFIRVTNSFSHVSHWTRTWNLIIVCLFLFLASCSVSKCFFRFLRPDNCCIHLSQLQRLEFMFLC